MKTLLQKIFSALWRGGTKSNHEYETPVPIAPEEHEQRLREMLIGIYGENHRHKSFLSSHANKKWSQLGAIYERLLSDDSNVTDDEIINAYKATSPFETNSIYAAEAEFSSIATLCYFRPHLTEVLLENGMLDLIASYGENLSGENVVDFVNYNLLRESAEPYTGLPHQQGIDWLSNELPRMVPTLEKVMQMMIIRNRLEIDGMN